MKRYFFILSLFVLGFSINDVHKEIITIDWKIPVNLDKNSFSNEELTFEGADYYPEVNSLPYFTKIYDVGISQNFTVVGGDFEYETVQFQNESPEIPNETLF